MFPVFNLQWCSPSDEDMDGASSSKSFSRSDKRASQRSQKELKRSPSFTATDDIDKMKVYMCNPLCVTVLYF